MDDNEWVLLLKEMLSKLLLKIIQKDELYYYFTEDAMKIWIDCFTNETYSPSKNNEEYEFLGDAILEYVFPKYTLKRFPYLRKNELTELKTRYMSKTDQGELGYEMGFSKKDGTRPHIIRTKGLDIIPLNLVADTFEAFFGGLDTISDNIRTGLGYANCYNMIVILFQDKKINDAGSHAKTQIEQLFTRFELPKPFVIIDKGSVTQIKFTPKMISILSNNKIKTHELITEANNKEEAYLQTFNELQKLGIIEGVDSKQSNRDKNNQIFDVVLTNKHLDFLRNYGLELTSSVIGHGVAPTKKAAEFKAYSSALSFLSNIKTSNIPNGITTEWAEKQKLLSDISHVEVSKYIEAVAKKLSKEGFVNFKFVIPSKTSGKKNALIQLLGICPNGEKYVLGSTFIDQKDRKKGNIEARSLLMKTYSEEKS